MKEKFFEKHETLIAIGLIVIYVLSNSFCMQNFGNTDFRTTIVNALFSLIIIGFIAKNKLGEYYGLTSFPKPKQFLYFIPLFVLMSVNLWSGVNINNTINEIIAFMISMVFVGFLEEIIFRGFLYKMMAKDNVKTATLVTSLTFGIGHIINLLNGADLVPTLIQVVYAIATGYLFVVILQKGKSLWPCIITHSVVNALSIFNVENTVSLYVAPVILTIIPLVYAMYLNKKIK